MKKFILLLFTSIILTFPTCITFGQWVKMNGITGVNVKCIYTSGEYVYAGTYGNGVYISSDSGLTWNQINTGLTNLFVIDFTKTDGTIFAATAGGGVLKSNIGSSSWTPVNNGLASLFIRSIFNSDKLYLTADCQCVYSSVNLGDNWDSETNDSLSTSGLTCITGGSGKLYGGTSDGVFVLNTGSSYWVKADPFTSAQSLTIKYINGFIYLGTYGDGIFRSLGGLDWTKISNGLLDDDIYCITNSGTNIFIGTGGWGVYHSTDNGSNWQEFNTNLANYYINALSVSDLYLYAGGYGGIWRRPLSDITTAINYNSQEIITKFCLKQNYPNPFNPRTTISYQLPKTGNLTLKVYDILGNEIATLVNEEKPCGTYEVEFNPASPIGAGSIKNPTSGIYFYQLKAGDFIQTKKMILLK